MKKGLLLVSLAAIVITISFSTSYATDTTKPAEIVKVNVVCDEKVVMVGDKKVMTVKKDDKGNIEVTDPRGKKIPPTSVKEANIQDQRIMQVSDDTVIVAKKNPNCVWYFWGGWYWMYCW